jgi:hypothetical protein
LLWVRFAEVVLNCNGVALCPWVDHLGEVAADEAGGAYGDAAAEDPKLVHLLATTRGLAQRSAAGDGGAHALHLSRHLVSGAGMRGVRRLEGLRLQVELPLEAGSKDREQVTRCSRLPCKRNIVRNG